MQNRLIAALCVATALLGGGSAARAVDAPKAPATATGAAAHPTKARPVDINSAPSAALQQVPGIGEAEAAKIIAGRPYNSKADLVSRKIISDSTYAAIRDRIIAKPGATVTRAAK